VVEAKQISAQGRMDKGRGMRGLDVRYASLSTRSASGGKAMFRMTG